MTVTKEMDPDTILRITSEIAQSRQTPVERKQHYGFIYKEFAEAYPTLMEMACNAKSTADLSHLGYMMNQWRQVQSGAVSQNDASIKVGSLLVDKYIKPTLSPQ